MNTYQFSFAMFFSKNPNENLVWILFCKTQEMNNESEKMVAWYSVQLQEKKPVYGKPHIQLLLWAKSNNPLWDLFFEKF